MKITRMMKSSLCLAAIMVGGNACSQQTEAEAPAAAETPAGVVSAAVVETPAVVNELSPLIAGALIKADGSAAPDDALAGKTVALYFSAQWCPPCRAFTPVLVEAYNQWKEQEKPIELVFVSSDRNAAAMASYMSDYKMPWLAVPFEDGARRQALGAHWSIRGIPALVVVGPDGETVSSTGTQTVRQHKAAAIDEWIKP